MNSVSVEKLEKARELIARPGGYTKGVFARDGAGVEVEATDRKATCFCALGALEAAGLEDAVCDDRLPEALLLKKAARIRTRTIPAWSDASGQARVVEAFDRAIELARAG